MSNGGGGSDGILSPADYDSITSPADSYHSPGGGSLGSTPLSYG